MSPNRLTVSDTLGPVASWVVRETATKRVLFETFSIEVAQSINTRRYEAVPILAYLQELNRNIKAQS